MAASKVAVTDAVPPVPLFLSSVTEYVLARHLAQYVVSELGTVLEASICVPPVAALVLNQPTKEYPVLAFGVGSVPKVFPGAKNELAGDPEPPL